MITLPLSPRQRVPLRKAVYASLTLVACLVLLHISRYGYPSFKHKFEDSVPEDESAASPPVSAEEWNRRAERVKEAFRHAYHGYEKYAQPKDELRPVTNVGMSGYNGWGATAFDALDTMLLMDLEPEYKRALEVVKVANFSVTYENRGFVPYFETIIRYLGGLLSAYALSKDEILLWRAEELANTLDPVFNTPSGLPAFSYEPVRGLLHIPDPGVLAEFASFQVEYTYLAKVTGKKKYYDRVKTLNRVFQEANLSDSGGMLPTEWNLREGAPRQAKNRISVGARADSTHEYLLKQYLLTGKIDKGNLEAYLRTTTYILTNLLYLSPKRGLLYATDAANTSFTHPAGTPSHTFEHLSCFLPGLLALGAHTLPLNDLQNVGIDFATLGSGPLYSGTGDFYRKLQGYDLKKLHLWAAEGLAHTCWLTYADQKSGLGPEEVMMLTGFRGATTGRWWDPRMVQPRGGNPSESYLWIDTVAKWKKSGSRGPVPGWMTGKPVVWTEEDRLAGRPNTRDYHVRKPGYLLRPETVESFYILWRTTRDERWRNRGWAVFEAVERETKTESGYVTLKDVRGSPTKRGNSMPSFFLAETLKYLYLLFREDDPLPLDKWVFNTEAHPVPVFSWTEEERERFSV